MTTSSTPPPAEIHVVLRQAGRQLNELTRAVMAMRYFAVEMARIDIRDFERLLGAYRVHCDTATDIMHHLPKTRSTGSCFALGQALLQAAEALEEVRAILKLCVKLGILNRETDVPPGDLN